MASCVTDAGDDPRAPCGHEIGVDDPVYLWYETRIYGYSFGAVLRRGCVLCAAEWVSRPPRTLRDTLRAIRASSPHVRSYSCPECGRDVVVVRVEDVKGRRRSAYYCSGRCRDERRLRVARERRARAREKACAECGAEFTATRSDAKTCSPACRQKAYRRRLSA
jgi:predicted RNA-binding Zn-ribbon protein involved in translation (DUF1610 family)